MQFWFFKVTPERIGTVASIMYDQKKFTTLLLIAFLKTGIN